MKLVKVELLVRHRGTDETGWVEDYQRPEDEDHEAWGRWLIDRFNSTLRPGERPRELMSAKSAGKATGTQHNWEKTNLMTRMGFGSTFDEMKCRVCGVTGRRYGVGEGGVQLDSEYRAKAYQFCDTAAALIEKRRKRAARS